MAAKKKVINQLGEVKKVGDNGHKSNWVTILKNHLVDIKGAGWVAQNLVTIDGLIDDIKAVTALLPDGGALTALLASIASILEDTGTTLPGTLATIAGYIDTEIAAILAAVDTEVAAILADTGELQTDWVNGGRLDLLIDAITAHLTDIKGVGWTTETLVAIQAAIGAIAGVNTYQEQIPDTHINLAAIDNVLTADPPAADAENSVVDIDAVGGSTFVLRSLWVNVTSLAGATKLIFKLWVPINGVITAVDSVDVASLGIQNLADIFGLQEVHADSIHITVQTDAGNTGACAGTYKYAKAS